MTPPQADLAREFERQRPRLTAIAGRLLGSSADAEDAVQEAWLRLTRSDVAGVDNLPGWLTTVTARVCLNVLRSRRSHSAVPLETSSAELGAGRSADDDSGDPEQQAVLSDSVGLAMLVVLEVLSPDERLAFVLHDVFGLPFDEIAPILGRTSTAARQLASRARRRVRGACVPAPDRRRKEQLVQAYLSAARDGDFAGLLALLHPDVVLRADAVGSGTGAARVLRGAEQVVRGPVASSPVATRARLVFIDGDPAVALLTDGRPTIVLTFVVVDGLITRIAVIGDGQALSALSVRILDR